MSGGHRRKRTTTNREYTQMVRRLIRAWGRRAEVDIEASMSEFRDLEAELQDAANLAIWKANRIGGVSVNKIAAALRISKQGAHKRIMAGERIAAQQQRWDAELTSARPRELPAGKDGPLG